MATTTQQHRGHGHSHGPGGHHHHHDNTYLVSKNKNDPGVRITRIGLYSNLGMAIVKGAGGYAFGSQALVADAWHSLTDLASDVLTLATVSWSLRPPTDKFPVGFGKVESLGSLGVSGMLLFGGLYMCASSCTTLYAQLFLDGAEAAALLEHAHGHGHSHGGHGHGHGHGVPSLHAAWLSAGTVVVKEWLYQATMKVALERKSSVLMSNAMHHRVDSLTGIVALAAIVGANVLHNATWLDPVGGLLIALLVIRAGWGNTLSALYELADRGIDEDVRRSVERNAAKVAGEGVEVRDVTGTKSGQNYLIEIEMGVPSEWTVERVGEVEGRVRKQVGEKVRGARRVKVRFVPRDGQRVEGEFIDGEVSQRSSPEPEEEEHDHDHHDHGNGKGKKEL
ncbi:cation efflux family-domain-containing protein [Podospora conica]|nr:cation efflux family-domain-containing protein [Schizothecium conicum]